MTALHLLRRLRRPGRWGGLVLLLAIGLGSGAPFGPGVAHGQAPLHLVNAKTTVSEVSFRFVGGKTFETSRLREQISTRAPGVFARLRNRLAFLPVLKRQTVLFDPVTLQKDVVRLRRFYRQNGFPQPQVDYPATQLDTTTNRIHVIFTIREGAPLTIREMAFLTADGAQPIATQFDGGRHRQWTQFRQQLAVRVGERYTDFERTRIQSDVQTWLRNRGYAFAQVQSAVQIDSAANAVDLRFLIDAGPLARVSEIVVEGNTSVSDAVVRRELPFQIGDRFSAADVTDGQRALFDLNLFRVALADVPDQPRDSTVTVRYRVRETKLRAYSGKIGYGTESGITLEGSWRHRNFQGNARSLVISLTADTGFPRDPSRLVPFLTDDPTKNPNRLFRASVTFRQPYLFTEHLSGTLEPFFQERRSPTLSANPDRSPRVLERLGLNERQFGLNTTLIYDFLPFRSLSLRHSFARIEQFREEAAADVVQDDLFDKSIFSLSGTFGTADDFINPSRGYILRPTLEVGGVPFESGVEFTRLSGEVSGYLPLGNEVQLAGRLFGGVLVPFAESRDRLTIPPTAPAAQRRLNQTYQNRFSDYLFYAGGPSDVRGWTSQLAGGKVLRDLDGGPAATRYAYRPTGARSKLGANLEVRLPFPGLGTSWRTAVFVDAARLDDGSLTLTPPADSVNAIPGPDGRPVSTDPSQLVVGTGVGLRYETPFGFLRLDVAYKVTPDVLDLRRPNEVGREVNPPVPTEPPQPPTAAPTHPVRRFRLHFGIGRSF